MGVCKLETYLEKNQPNGFCRSVSIKELAQQYRIETGKDPVMIVDGSCGIRVVYKQTYADWMLGGQLKEFVEAMNNFVSAFRNIGVRVMFYFDGATPEWKRSTWIERRDFQINTVLKLIKNLKCNNHADSCLSLFPPIVGATGRFVAKFECQCDVRVSLSEGDSEMAEFAAKEDCFAILSRDTDFVFLQGARHYLSIQRLDMETMTTLTYSREGLQRVLDLQPLQLLLLVSLLGNDIIPSAKLKRFHKRVSSSSTNIFIILPGVVEYIKEQNVPDNVFEYLYYLAKDVFNNENMAQDLETSIRFYLPPSAEETEDTVDDGVAEDVQPSDENWKRILQMVKDRHTSCNLPSYLYPVMVGNAYELCEALEDYDNRNVKLSSEIYLPLRKRIYGVLLNEKPGACTVTEWCIRSRKCPREPSYVSIARIPNIEKLHPGLLHLWHEDCHPDVRWRLLTSSLSQERELDPMKLKKLGFPYAVPVAVLFYLMNECCGELSEIEVDVILAQAVVVSSSSATELRDINCESPTVRVVQLSTIFHRGVTTVLFLLAACGFPLDEAMPWHYFDGKLLHQKYIQAMKYRARPEQLCNDMMAAWRLFKSMKALVLPPKSWRQ